MTAGRRPSPRTVGARLKRELLITDPLFAELAAGGQTLLLGLWLALPYPSLAPVEFSALSGLSEQAWTLLFLAWGAARLLITLGGAGGWRRAATLGSGAAWIGLATLVLLSREVPPAGAFFLAAGLIDLSLFFRLSVWREVQIAQASVAEVHQEVRDIHHAEMRLSTAAREQGREARAADPASTAEAEIAAQVTAHHDEQQAAP